MMQFTDYQKKYLINKRKDNVVIFGAGTLGKLTLIALSEKGIKVDYLCDSDIRKQGKEVEKIKIISPEDLDKLDKNADIFIAAIYFSSILPVLKNKGFKYLYITTELLET